jgi:hypothetical protein
MGRSSNLPNARALLLGDESDWSQCVAGGNAELLVLMSSIGRIRGSVNASCDARPYCSLPRE